MIFSVASNEDFQGRITQFLHEISHSPTMAVLYGFCFWIAESTYNFASSFSPNLTEGMINMYRRGDSQ